jgi:hypothetical protein
MRAGKLSGLKVSSNDERRKIAPSLHTWGFWLYFARKIVLMMPRYNKYQVRSREKGPTESTREVADNFVEVAGLRRYDESKRA